MANAEPISLDVLIFGGGAAGLWLLDELRRAGYRVLLLESQALGSGQTVASQGIIHGGLKYTLTGMFTRSADAIRDMPQVWRDCLAGRREPDLSRTRVRAEFCHLWRTSDLRSVAGMIGARVGLRVAPEKLDRAEWPTALAGCPGEVYRLDEQVIDPASLLADLAARNTAELLLYDADSLTVESDAAGVATVSIRAAAQEQIELSLRAATFVLTAGGGNAALRRSLGFADESMQRRPLHMAMVRGDLPVLNGHCADGARTRVTISTAIDSAGRTVWQIGGQLAEDGVAMDRSSLVAHARRELQQTLPGFEPRGTEWASYRVDRAEAAAGGKRPDNVSIRRDGNIITAWPTKLALVPRLADEILATLPPPRSPLRTPSGSERVAAEEPLTPSLSQSTGRGGANGGTADWPRPVVAAPPWDTEAEWIA